MSVVQALLIALFVAAVESRALGYATLTMRFSPLMAGFVVGLVLGNMPLAMTTVATIQLIYMGVVAPGGAMPSSPALLPQWQFPRLSLVTSSLRPPLLLPCLLVCLAAICISSASS